MEGINYQFEIFKYESEEESQFNELRTIEENGNILFCATDIARMIGYSNPRDAIAKHCKLDGVVFRDVIDSLGRPQKMKFITEGNAYRLIIGSQLPSADKFETWIFDEVIPSIRKKGYYGNIDRAEEPNFLTRFKENDTRIPLTHFSVISELYLVLNRELEHLGYVIPNKSVEGREIRPDNSVGRIFITYLEDNYPEMLNYKKEYMHKFPNGYEFPANMYPYDMLHIFRDFVYKIWLPKHAAKYLGKRDPKSLEYLPKVIEKIKEEYKLDNLLEDKSKE